MGTWALALQKNRGGLRLVDISRIPSGTLKKKVNLISEMAGKYGQIVTFCAVSYANSARDRPAIVVQALLELVAALVARF